ncbi:MAG: T9SS type A sorting domain-containing protein [Flavobacteriia bacterium]|jgi:hypothetical protein
MERRITFRNLLLLIVFFISSYTIAATITAKPAGGNWNAPGTWDLNRVPACGDVIVIPFGVTVNIPANVNFTGCAAGNHVTVQVNGRLTFSNGRKLRLSAGGCVQVSVTGQVVPSGVGGGNSELIEIDSQDWWQAADGTLLGSSSPTGVNLGCGVMLPVELSYFDLEYENEAAKISFASSSERDLVNYTVEISRDGSFWQELETVKAVGNSNENQTYSVVDKTPFIGVSYYRLRSKNLDGTTRSLGLITGEFTSVKYLLYPVPVNKTLFVEGSDLDKASVTVVSSLGDQMEVESTLIGDKLSFNFSEVKSGVYFLVIETQNTKKTERVVVVHK